MKYVTRILILSGILFILTPLWTNLYTAYYQKEMRNYIKTNKDKNDYKSFEMVIPKISVDSLVVEGTDKSSLKKGPGHYYGSALPGEKGNMIIAGHRTTYGRVFFNIDKLETGNEINFYYNNQRFVYLVSAKKIINPKDVSVLKDTKEALVTLITCEPIYSAQKRLVILARLK